MLEVSLGKKKKKWAWSHKANYFSISKSSAARHPPLHSDVLECPQQYSDSTQLKRASKMKQPNIYLFACLFVLNTVKYFEVLWSTKNVIQIKLILSLKRKLNFKCDCIFNFKSSLKLNLK